MRVVGPLLPALLLALASCPTGSRELPRVLNARPAAEAGAPVPVVVRTVRGTVHGVAHPVTGARTAVVMVGGAGGGIEGPARIYPVLAERLQAEGIASLRLHYRRPGDLEQSVYDLRAALRALERSGVQRVLLLGWSFGGAVVVAAGATSDAVVGVATFAAQSHGTEAAARLAPRSLLLFHGTADPVLGDWNSRLIHARAGEPKELVLYAEEGHTFVGHRDALLEKLLDWGVPLLRPERAGRRD